MKLRSSTIARIACLLALATTIAMGAYAGADAQPLGPGEERVIAQNGFGEPSNSYAWSMGWFKGKLYVGTGRDVLCVEDETVNYFLPLTNKYTVTPLPNVHCPHNPYAMHLRAQIWQYTPHTKSWKRVYRSPASVRNPFEPSQSVATDIAYRGMLTYTGPHGRKALFAAGVSADEYLPQLLRHHPPRLLRSFDGVHWQSLNVPSVVVHYPQGNTRAMGFRTLLQWRGHLYVTATPDLTGDGALFEVTHPFSTHAGLRQVSPANLDIFEATVFRGNLYVGCGSATQGYSVWEASGHGRPFIPVVTGGAGRGAIITSVVSMHAFRGSLYVGASGWYHEKTLPLSEMIRIDGAGQWTLVVGAPRRLANGHAAYPTSGLSDGFDSLFNAHFWRMASTGGGLYVGTNSWAYLVKQGRGNGWLADVLASASGYQLWGTCDGEDWYAITRDAFGTSEYDFGARTLQPEPGGGSLYIGSANHAQGTMILDDRDPLCGSLVHGREARAARSTHRSVRPARPSAMIADNLAKGTLLSWKASPAATRYQILAAPEVNLTVWLKPPPTLPGGFQLEGATPTVTSPEAPGSLPVQVGVTGQFEPVASTTGSSYIARTHTRRVYEVVAENAAGETSEPSNVQIGPTPEPPSTFASLRTQLVPASGSGSGAFVARAGHTSRAGRVLDAAEADWWHGHQRRALRRLAQLQRMAGSGEEEVAALAMRLERRLRYGGSTP